MNSIMQNQTIKIFFLCGIFAHIYGCIHQPSTNKNIVLHRYTETPLSFSKKHFPKQDIQKLQKAFPIKTAESLLRQSESLYRLSLSAYLPQISASVERTHQRLSPFMAIPDQESKLTTYQIGLSAELIPDFFGKTKLQAEIAESQKASSFYNLELVKLNTINAYTKNYHLLCYFDKLKEIQINTNLLNQKIFDISQKRYNAGLLKATDYYLAKDSVYVGKTAIETIKQSYLLAEKNYYTLLGESVPEKSDNVCKNGFIALPTKMLKIPINILDHRPDIQIAQTNIQTATQNYNLSLKAFYPDAFLIFNISDVSDDFYKILDAKEIAWNFLSQLTQLVYDGGRRRYNQNIAQEEFKIATIQYKELFVDAVNATKQLTAQFKSADRNETISLNRLKDAQKALDIAKLNYISGVIPLIEFLNLERNLYQAQQDFMNTQHEKRVLYSDLLTALGVRAIYLSPKNKG